MLVSEHLAHAVAAADDLLDVCDLEPGQAAAATRVEAVDEVADLTRVVGRHLNGDLVELLTVGVPAGPPRGGRLLAAAHRARRSTLAVAQRQADERLSVEAIELSRHPGHPG